MTEPVNRPPRRRPEFPVYNPGKFLFLLLSGIPPTRSEFDPAEEKPRLVLYFDQTGAAPHNVLFKKLHDFIMGNTKEGYLLTPDEIMEAVDRFWDESGIPYLEDAGVAQ